MEKQIENILSQVAEIVQQEKEQKEFTGNNFNIFDILGLNASETKHSTFLAELLNPKGRHGFGDSFLRAFIKSVDCLKDWDFNVCNAEVKTEYDIGPINQKYTQGGKIDVLIKSQEKAIIIENKIYADDQPSQLIRYNNFAKKTFKSTDNYRLIYLTLDGREASYGSTGYQLKVDDDYYAIGYSSEILEWLKVSESESSRNVMVCSSITQYIKTIEDLINQNMLPENSDRIVEIMSHPENVEAVLAIRNHINEWENKIVEKYLIPQLQEWAQSNNLKFKIDGLIGSKQKNQGCGMCFYKEKWSTAVWIYTEHKKEWKDFFIGVSSIDENKSMKGYTNRYQLFNGYNNANIWWPYGRKYLDEYKTWYPETMIDIAEGKVAAYIIKEVKEVLNTIDQLGVEMP